MLCVVQDLRFQIIEQSNKKQLVLPHECFRIWVGSFHYDKAIEFVIFEYEKIETRA